MDKLRIIKLVSAKLKKESKNLKLTEKELDSLEKELINIKTPKEDLNSAFDDLSTELIEDSDKFAKVFWDRMSHLPVQTENDLNDFFNLIKKHAKPILDKYKIPIKWDIKEFDEAVMNYQGGLAEQQYERDYYNR